jgi:hypothetical protein
MITVMGATGHTGRHVEMTRAFNEGSKRAIHEL